jgi:hypothetical protein
MTTKEQRSEYAAALGKQGGKARAASMSPEERRDAAKRAIAARWKAYRERKKQENKP